MTGPKRLSHLADTCPSCGGSMPLDWEGGYACEVYTCINCGQLICEDCQSCPAEWLTDGDPPLYLLKYFSDKGYGDHDDLRGIHDTYCRACLSKVEVAYVESIPVGELLIHMSDEWLWDEGRALYLKRLSQGE